MKDEHKKKERVKKQTNIKKLKINYEQASIELKKKQTGVLMLKREQKY